MSWIFGSCSGPSTAWIQLSNALVAAATSTSVKTVAVSAGGSGGYVIGDILTLTSGTSTIAAQVEVTGASGGVATSVRLYNAGVYSGAPSSPSATSGGSGTGATITNTSGTNGWTAQRDIGHELSAVDSIVGGGTGYDVDDIITLAGGTFDTVAKLKVTTESGNVITGVTIEDVGDYNAIPTDPVGQASVAPTGGSGATFNLSFDDGEREVILKGTGGGGDEIFVGWRTFSNVSSNYYNLEMHGMTGFNTTVAMTDQPGVSPGFWDAGTDAGKDGCYLLAINSSLNYWVSITAYRIIGVIEVGGKFFNFYLGWGNRFATASEYPYPMCIAAHSTNHEASYGQATATSGLCDPRSTGSDVFGPMCVLFTDSTWYDIDNKSNERICLPCADPGGITDGTTEEADKFTVTALPWSNIIPDSGVPVASVRATPGTSDAVILVPAIIHFWSPGPQMVMELDNVYWTSGAGGIQSKDRAIVSNEVYRIFQNCNRSEVYTFLAIKEI